MNNNNNSKPPNEDPHILRMLHPTSGRQGFPGVNIQPVSPVTPAIDPRLAMAYNMQAQQAINAYGVSTGFPYQAPIMPTYSPYMYGIYQPYQMYPRRF